MGEEERLERGISRRSMLKRIGAAGAVAWVTPVITSINTPAYAQRETPCTPGPCGAQPVCGDGCTCIPTPSGAGFCHAIVGCQNPNVHACTTDADCNPGWRCSSSCCGDNLCHPPCFEAEEDVVAGLGGTSAG